MAATCTYQNLGIRLFVSRKDFLAMLDQNWIFADLYYRGDIVAERAVYVSLSDPALQFLREVYAGELEAIDVLKRQKKDDLNEKAKTKEKEALLGKQTRLPSAADHVPTMDG
jgi:hypothetical protein